MPISTKVFKTNQSTASGTALTTFENTLYCAFRANDPSNNLYYTTSLDGENWDKNRAIGVKTLDTPALVNFKSQLFCFYRPDNQSGSLKYAVLENKSKSLDWAQLDTGNQAGSTASVIGYNIKGAEILVCAYKGFADSNIYIITSSDGKNWSSPQKIAQTTKEAPSLSILNGYLVCSFVANDPSNRILSIVSTDGKTWGQERESCFATGEGLTTTTIIWNNQELIVCAFKSNNNDKDLLFICTNDALNWRFMFLGGQVGQKSPKIAGLSVLGDRLFCTFVTNDNSNAIVSVNFKTPPSVILKLSEQNVKFQYMEREYVDYQIDANKDIHAVLKNTTASGLIEIATMSAASNYTKCTQHVSTALSVGEQGQKLFLDVNKNLIAVTKCIDSNEVVIQAATAASGYKEINKATATLTENSTQVSFALAANSDILCIVAKNNAFEAVFMLAESGYQQTQNFNFQFPESDLAYSKFSYHLDGANNLYAIKTSGNSSYQTEIYAFSAASKYQSTKVGGVQFPLKTVLPEVGMDETLLIDQYLNLHVLNTNPVGHSKVIHKVLEVSSGYQKINRQIATGFDAFIYPDFDLAPKEVAFYDGVHYTGNAWKFNGTTDLLKNISFPELQQFSANQIASLKLGKKTGIQIKNNEHHNFTDYIENSGYIKSGGIVQSQMFVKDSEASAGIHHSVLLTEDYRYNAQNKLESFMAYQTVLSFKSGLKSIKVFADKPITLHHSNTSSEIDNVQCVTIPITEKMQYLALSIEAQAIGTSALRIQSDQMQEDEFLGIYPDQQLHHKIAHLPQDTIYNNQDKLGVSKTYSQQDCHHIQKTVQNFAKAAKYPKSTNSYAALGEMDDPHWKVSFGNNSVAYTPISKEESQRILNNSTHVNANSGTLSFLGFFEHLGNDIENIGSIVVHSVETAAKDIEHGVEEAAQDVEHAAETALSAMSKFVNKVGHDIEEGVEDIEHGIEKAIKVTFQYLDKAATYIIEGAEEVGHVLTAVFNKIKADIQKVINFFSALFDWQEIARIGKVFGDGVNSFLRMTQNKASQFKEEIDNKFKKVDKEVVNYFDEVRELLGLPPEQPPTPSVSPSAMHTIMWVISKIQDGVSDVFSFGGAADSNKGTNNKHNISDQLKKLEQKLITLGINDVAQVLETLEDGLSKIIQKPHEAGKTIIETLLNVFEEIVLDALKIAQCLFDFIMEIVEDLLSDMFALFNDPLSIPFLGDLMDLLKMPKVSLMEFMGYLTAIPLVIYEKENNTTLFKSGFTLSDGDDKEAHDLRIANDVCTIITGLIMAGKALTFTPSAEGEEVELSVLDKLALGMNIVNQIVRYPDWYMSNDTEGYTGIQTCWWIQQIIAVGSLAFCFLPSMAIVNAILQVIRLICIIIVLFATSNSFKTNQKVADLLAPIPGILNVVPALAKGRESVNGLIAVLQVLVAVAYSVEIWPNGSSTNKSGNLSTSTT